MKSLPNREDRMLRLVVVTSPAAAQDSWPSKPITVIVPFGAGGNTDSLARIYSARLSARTSLRRPGNEMIAKGCSPRNPGDIASTGRNRRLEG
jgi:hypothetical protein